MNARCTWKVAQRKTVDKTTATRELGGMKQNAVAMAMLHMSQVPRWSIYSGTPTATSGNHMHAKTSPWGNTDQRCYMQTPRFGVLYAATTVSCLFLFERNRLHALCSCISWERSTFHDEQMLELIALETEHRKHENFPFKTDYLVSNDFSSCFLLEEDAWTELFLGL